MLCRSVGARSLLGSSVAVDDGRPIRDEVITAVFLAVERADPN
jgi:hypothetical protein